MQDGVQSPEIEGENGAVAGRPQDGGTAGAAAIGPSAGEALPPAGCAPLDAIMSFERTESRAIPPRVMPALRRLEARRGLYARAPENAYGRWGHTFAAVDLGTNNCRLLIARPHQTGFKVVDAFSRTVRLGEGLTSTRKLSPHAMNRTLDALKVVAEKMRKRGVTQARAVATEACRTAENADEFISRAEEETGLSLEIISTKEEARLAVESCQNLVDRSSDNALVFDIGGGSTELVWLDLKRDRKIGAPIPIEAWTSLPYGVVTLTEKFGHEGRLPADNDVYRAMVEAVRGALSSFDVDAKTHEAIRDGRAHLVGNSGTVTTIAGVLLGLQRYDRSKVDGAWIDLDEAMRGAKDLSARTWAERAAHPCIGPERADLLMPGAAILEAIRSVWPCRRLRVADRGLREGVLLAMMAEADRDGRRRTPRRPQTDEGAGQSD